MALNTRVHGIVELKHILSKKDLRGATVPGVRLTKDGVKVNATMYKQLI